MDKYDDIFNSPSLDESLQHATLVATLAERFKLTSFKHFQQEVIHATLQGKDTLVMQPTGSGKSLCFLFPPVHENKKAVVITPTISLMQDQVEKLNGIGINAVFLGSAQLDKHAETRALELGGRTSVVFVTPEWMAKPANQAKLQTLVRANQLSLIAIDEAHLFTEWSRFRSAFTDLKNLKYNFPIMALTATANLVVEDEIKLLLRHPVVYKESMNHPNITLKLCRRINITQVSSSCNAIWYKSL